MFDEESREAGEDLGPTGGRGSGLEQDTGGNQFGPILRGQDGLGVPGCCVARKSRPDEMSRRSAISSQEPVWADRTTKYIGGSLAI